MYLDSALLQNSPLPPEENVLLPYMLFERSEFLIDTGTSPKKIRPSARVHACAANIGFSVEKIVFVLVGGTSERLVQAKKK